MDFKRFNKFYLVLTIVFIFILITGFALFSQLEGVQNTSVEDEVTTLVEKPVITEDTVIQKEIKYVCGTRMVNNIPTTEDLVGLEYQGFLTLFPPEEGWVIDDSTYKLLIVTRSENEICSLHQNYFHLGVYDEKLAIYKGPLGYKESLLKTEDITVDQLPQELQKDLKLVEEYEKQSLETKVRLQSHLEFEDEESIKKALFRLWEELDELF